MNLEYIRELEQRIQDLTPTYYEFHIQEAAEQQGNVEIVVTLAERLPNSVARMVRDTFTISSLYTTRWDFKDFPSSILFTLMDTLALWKS